ncbi:MAG: PocR ligand-binding domain-containing protein [Anaerolineae bacterium]|jgi:signal transduction histidine kinase|nr:PocR ligand-binding domain-containing protein [Anaerolineae bacterium]
MTDMTLTPTRDPFLDMIDDVESFKLILEDTFRDWHGSFDVLMEQTGEYLFNAKHDARFCAFCAALRTTPEGEKRCRAFDESLLQRIKAGDTAEFYTCHAGLTDVAVPIVIDGKLVATILFGQVLLEDVKKQDHFYAQAHRIDHEIGMGGALEATTGGVPVVTANAIHEVRRRVERIAQYVAVLGADRMRLKRKLRLDEVHLAASEVIRATNEQLNDVTISWDEFWNRTSALLDQMRQIIGAMCGFILIPRRGQYSGQYITMSVAGLPTNRFSRRSYELDPDSLTEITEAHGVVVPVNPTRASPVRQSLIEYDPAFMRRIDKVYKTKLDFGELGFGVLVYYLNELEDVANDGFKINNGERIEMNVLAQFASSLALAFKNRRVHERALNNRKEHVVWLEKVSHQLVQSVGTVRAHTANIQEFIQSLHDFSPQAFINWNTTDLDWFLNRINDIMHTANNANRMSLNLLRSAISPKLMKNIEWDYEVVGSVPKLMIDLSRDFQAMAKARYISRVHVVEDSFSAMDDRLKIVTTDRLFHQAVSNLLENAVKYSYRNAEVLVSGEVTPDDQAVIRITNEGIRLPPEEVERIFEHAYRAPEAMVMNAPGTGIGLTVAREIIEMHGGTLTAEPSVRSRKINDKPYWKTTFTITLPLVAAGSDE